MIGVPTQQSVRFGKALPVQVLHNFTPDSAVFDDDNLVSLAGLVPVLALAEQTALSELLADEVDIAEPRIKSGSANPAPKLATVIAGMCAGADSIDDRNLLREFRPPRALRTGAARRAVDAELAVVDEPADFPLVLRCRGNAIL